MRILVNTGVLLHDDVESYHCFLNEILEMIVNRNGKHEFIILAKHADAGRFVTCSNVTLVTGRHPLRHPLLIKTWYDLKLPAILKKYRAELFLSFDGFCSLTTRLPQCVLVADHSLIAGNTSRSRRLWSLFYERFVRNAFQKANSLVCWSDFKKKDLMLRYPLNEKKLSVIYPAAKASIQPLNELVKEEVRKSYSDERNYFVYTGAFLQRKELFNLLKAFSVFKKRQKSNWKILLMGGAREYDNKFLHELRSYKFRDDVVVISDERRRDAARLIGSAYALICAVYSESSVFPVLQAMKCQIPVIAADTPLAREIAGEAALYFDPSDFENIAGQMMVMYKDESHRNRLIDQGKLIGAKYSIEKSADLLWECFCNASADCKPL